MQEPGGPENMSRRLFLRSAIGYAGGAWSLGMIGVALDRTGVIDINLNPPKPGDPEVNSARPSEGLATDEEEADSPEREALSLDVAPLSPEVEARYVNGLVRVNTSVKETYPRLGGSTCTGAVTENGWVVTSAHCTRRVSDEQNNSYRVISDDGEDVRERLWVERDGQEFTAGGEHYFTDYENDENKSLDITVLEVDGTVEAGATPLPFARPETLVRGTPLHLYSRFGEPGARTHGGIILRTPSRDNPYILLGLRVDDEENVASSPGVSGTVVITAQGEIAGVNMGKALFANGTETTSDDTPTTLITPEVARQYGLADSMINQRLALCNIVPGSLVQQLLD